MATPVILPRQGQSVESCIIGEWHKKVGDAVNEGDLLFTYETDKATFDEPAKATGTLLAIFAEPMDDVPVLTNVAVIGQPGEDATAFDPRNGAVAETTEATAAEQPAEQAAAPSPAVVEAPSTPAVAGAGQGISPRARGTAVRLGADAALASGTGPEGRVIERDILTLVQSGPPEQVAAVPVTTMVAYPVEVEKEYEDVRLTNIRKTIAKNMHQSLATMAQLTHTASFDASGILAYRAQLKAAAAAGQELPNITLNDIILFAASRVLLNHQDLNAHFFDDHIRRFKHVHLGMAVDTPRGLMVPTLRDADTKTLAQISREAKLLATQAIDGDINPDLLAGATFTISNLGALGIESFTPVINPPQTGILGVDCITERVRTVDGTVTAYPAMGLSLTYDHRAIDGAPASRFLKEMGAVLAQFPVLLAGY